MNTDSIEKLDTVNNTVTTPINNTVSDSVTKTRKVLSEKQLAGLQKARDAKQVKLQQKKTQIVKPIIPEINTNYLMAIGLMSSLGLLVYYYLRRQGSSRALQDKQAPSSIQMQPMQPTKSRATLDSFFS